MDESSFSSRDFAVLFEIKSKEKQFMAKCYKYEMRDISLSKKELSVLTGIIKEEICGEKKLDFEILLDFER